MLTEKSIVVAVCKYWQIISGTHILEVLSVKSSYVDIGQLGLSAEYGTIWNFGCKPSI
jgi:hypothetical protein